MVIGILILLFVLAIGCMLMFPAALIVMFLVEGIKVIKREGVKPSNLSSMLFAVLLYAYLFVWPMIGNIRKNTLSTMLYVSQRLISLVEIINNCGICIDVVRQLSH